MLNLSEAPAPAPYPYETTTDLQTAAVSRVISAMHEHLYDPLSLQDMADIAHYSPYHFNRLFRKVTGIPPNHFLYALRLSRAKRLLEETDLNVTEICFEVGYNSLGSFTSRFHQLIGVAPKSYRALARKGWEGTPHDICALSRAAEPRHMTQRGIEGVVETGDQFDGVVLVGLYHRAIPEGKPLACTFVQGTDRYALPPMRDGSYHALAIGVSWDSDAGDLLHFDGLPRGQSGPVTVKNGEIKGRTKITLQRRDHTQPPVLSCLPAMVGRQLGSFDPMVLEPA
jgi:AraC-like DNA-binding protein